MKSTAVLASFLESWKPASKIATDGFGGWWLPSRYFAIRGDQACDREIVFIKFDPHRHVQYVLQLAVFERRAGNLRDHIDYRLGWVE